MATIEPNFESICINPNDDLVLYKKEIVRSRIEKFLYAICSLDTDDLPTPLSRIEELYNCLVTGEDIPTFTPLSRAEKFVMAMLGAYDVELLPTPISRSETLMKKIATGDNNLDDIDNLQSRYEFLLAYIIKAGGFNGGSPDDPGDNGDFYYKLTSLTSGFTTINDTFDMPVKNAVLRGDTKLIDELGNECDEPNTPKIHMGAYVNETTGELVESAVSFHTDFLKSPNVNFIVKGNNRYKRIAYYDKDKKYIAGTNSTNKYNGSFRPSNILTRPENAVYYRISASLSLEADATYTPDTKLSIVDQYGETLYPTELVSVKMPVLTTTGKNLFDGEFEVGGINGETGNDYIANGTNRSINFIKVKPSTQYYLTQTTESRIFEYDKNKQYLRWQYGGSKTLSEKTEYIRISWVKTGSDNLIQLEEGSVATSYEPHKSNILTCNEEVELRGIGDIKDELNLVTGELTQRVGEIVLNGDENWNSYGSQPNQVNTVAFKLSHTNHISSWGTGFGCCDKLPFTNGNVVYGQDLEGVTTDANNIIVRVNKSKVSSVDEFKAWLSNNNIRVVYPLKEEVIKTVDLSIVDQDGKETELSTFDDITHVITSSEGLVPTGDIDIARPIQFVDYSLDNSLTTLYNTLEYPVKSAILKGQTLVNLVRNFKYQFGWKDEYEWGAKNTQRCCYNVESAKSNTKYLIKNFNETTQAYIRYYGDSNRSFLSITSWIGLPAIITTPTDTKKFSVSLRISDNNEEYISPDQANKNLVVEYQDGMENWDIPYFTGMQSVKMPVLTTTGKNLFYSTLESGDFNNSTGIPNNTSKAIVRSKDYIEISSNKTYRLTVFNTPATLSTFQVYEYDNDFNYIEKTDSNIFITNDNTKYVKFRFRKSDNAVFTEEELTALSCMITEGDTIPVTYEPYKSTTVSCNEEVELCSIGDIKDELNLVTGEYTKAIHEYTFTGDEIWTIGGATGGYTYFMCKLSSLPFNYEYKSDANIPIYCNNLPTVTYNDFDKSIKSVGINLTYFFRLNFSDCNSNNGATVEDLKAYLKANPTTVQYPISKSVKTVDLSTLDQNGKETKLNTFDDITHVIASSEGLIPTGEITVATKNAVDLIEASVMSLRMDDILNSQETLEGSANTQSDDIDVAMLGTTDIYEQLL